MLYRITTYVELPDDEQALGVFDAFADVACGGYHQDHGAHECGREFAQFVGRVDDSQVDWKQMLTESFSAIAPNVDDEPTPA